jgi:hypothetical protein
LYIPSAHTSFGRLNRPRIASKTRFSRDADQGDSFTPRVVPDESRQLVCILSKEVDRQDDDVRPEPAPDLRRLDPIVGDASLVPEDFEELAEGVRTMPAVVDVQDAEPACWRLHIAPPGHSRPNASLSTHASRAPAW